MILARSVASSGKPTLPSARQASTRITAFSTSLTALMIDFTSTAIAQVAQAADDDRADGHRLSAFLELGDEELNRLVLLALDLRRSTGDPSLA